MVMVSTEYSTEHLSDKQGFDARFNHNLVRLDYDWEVIYWCMVLQCTKQELEDAVRQVGNSSNDIRNVLRKN